MHALAVAAGRVQVAVAMGVQQVPRPQQTRQGAGNRRPFEYLMQVGHPWQNVVPGVAFTVEDLSYAVVQTSVKIRWRPGVEGDVTVAEEGLNLPIVEQCQVRH
jgi:hypothetical protein